MCRLKTVDITATCIHQVFDTDGMLDIILLLVLREKSNYELLFSLLNKEGKKSCNIGNILFKIIIDDEIILIFDQQFPLRLYKICFLIFLLIIFNLEH